MTPQVSVSYNGTALVKEVDYTLSYSNNKNVGTATVTITGKGYYKGSISKTFKIVPKEISIAWGEQTLFIYNGTEQAPSATAEGLVNGDECTITISGAAKGVGTYTATATALSNANYKLPTENLEKTFEITPKEISIAWGELTLLYNGTEQAPTATAEGLVNGDECTITVSGAAKGIGIYTATATSLSNGNYKLPTENLEKTFEIESPNTNIDLAIVGSHYTVKNGKVLTGTLAGNYKISIADGATVTLDGVAINGTDKRSYSWAGITCEGNCNIVLAENSTNTVKGFYRVYPGIYVLENKTLTISGTGSLDASSNGLGAGIGGGFNKSAGNIVISGGTITATGDHAAGIGGSNGGSVGNIVISGGTITAIGSVRAAGIGGGYGTNTSVGNIEISGSETKVTATKGDDAPYSIGKGNGGSRTGSITIGGIETSDIETSPFVWIPLTHMDITVIADCSDKIYTGSAICPAVSITDDGKTLELGTDYTTTCTNNISVGIAQMTITGMGNYAGSITKTFKIEPKEISIVWGEQTSFVYNGSEQAPTATLEGLVNDDDCSITVSGAAKGVGMYTATATALCNDNYKLPTENLEKTFEITPKEISIAWGEQTLFIYNGTEQAPTATAEGLVNGDECMVTVSGAAKDVGIYTATATALSNNNYKLPTENLEKTFEITPKEISIAWGEQTSFVYNGMEHAPTATAEGLVNDDDCSITVSGAAKDVGIYTATATALSNNNYKLPTENLEKAFEITYTNLAKLEGDYTAQDGEVLTGELAGNYKISVADGATVTLNGVTINGVNSDSYKWAGVTCEGNCNIILAENSTNTVKGFHIFYPGIYVLENKTLTISGTGSLDASSNGWGAGIGGGYNDIRSGNIVIHGGSITATGGTDAAGIGGGYHTSVGNIVIHGGSITATGGKDAAGIGGNNASVGNIEIHGGTITATGGQYAAGIGGGYNASIGNIEICGGTITATGGYSAVGIGGGYGGSVKNITISGDETKVIATKGDGARYSIGKGIYGSRKGTITIGGIETSDIETSPFVYTKWMKFMNVTIADIAEQIYTGSAICPAVSITDDGKTLELGTDYTTTCTNNISVGTAQMTITGMGDYAGSITKTFEITYTNLAKLEGDYTAQNGEVLTGTLAGNYKISIADGATVTLNGVTINGVYSDSYQWAGITCEGNCNIILAENSSNTVKGFYYYSGIYVPEGKTLTISGTGSLDASSNGLGAGIGGGNHTSAGNIVISGGTITATGDHAAGIGGGNHTSVGNIVIHGGSITATGGEDAAGIGGNHASVGNIEIHGGTITATGGQYAAGIGGGNHTSVGNIVIHGGSITATGGKDAAGIGGGYGGSVKNITISGDETKVIAIKGDDVPYSIGKGIYGSRKGTITIGGIETSDIETSPFVYTKWMKFMNVTVANIADQHYTGSAICPAVSITDDGKTLELGTDYTTTCTNNISVGTAQMTITGMGNYAGSITKTFEITYTNLAKLEGDYTAQDGEVLTGELAGNYKISVADGATVTLNGVTINGVNSDSYKWAGVTCEGDCNIILAENSSNAVKGFYKYYPGIYVPEGKTLAISGKGSLDVSVNGFGAAGIGGGRYIPCGNIVINGGSIKATGGDQAAAIGAGEYSSVEDITINGGIITAEGGINAAGIGGSCGVDGARGTVGNITITDGVTAITVIKGDSAPFSIGGGRNAAQVGLVTIAGVNVGEISKSPFEFTPSDIYTIEFDANGGNGNMPNQKNIRGLKVPLSLNGFTYEGHSFAGWNTESDGSGIYYFNGAAVAEFAGQTGGTIHLYAQWSNGDSPIIDLSKWTTDIVALGGEVLTGTLDGSTQPYKISIKDGAKVTLDGATINGENNKIYRWAGISCEGDCEIVLAENSANSVKGFYKNYPGIYVPENKTLTISGSGSLDASGNGTGGAGIGGGYQISCGNIVISGGTITAAGSGGAAGIGGGSGGAAASCGNIEIKGGTIVAKGGVTAAGIGVGREGSIGDIIISGGNVSAAGGSYAAGIGSGRSSSVGDITISGGNVTAAGGADAAGIGSGARGTIGNITITDGVAMVTATKGENAPYSIGAGINGSRTGSITIGGIETSDIETSPFVYTKWMKFMNVTVADIADQHYTGSAICPAVSITDGEKQLEFGTDYTVECSNNVSIGTANMTIIGKGDYSGTILKTFEITYTNLAKLEGDYTAQDGEVLTGTLAGNYKISIADGATVTLNGVTINGVYSDSYQWAGITCEGDCNIILAENSSNAVKSFYSGYPGIYVPEGKTLTISGTGSLDASGYSSAAGIGSGHLISCGNIAISGGTITATGGNSAAGIGGSFGGNVGDITISGGTITAMGGSGATGIGGGYDGDAGNIVISGGTVIATGSGRAAGIGGGSYGSVGDITISGDETKVTVTKGKDAPYSIGKGKDGSRTGKITIGGIETSDIETSPFVWPTPFADLTVTDIADQHYTGSAICPAVSVTDGEKTLVLATDYTVECSNNVFTGTANMTITGKGDYSGSITKTFKIVPEVLHDYAAVQVLKDQNGMHAVVNGDYSGSTPLNIPDAIKVDDIDFKRALTPLTPGTTVLPFSLPEGTTLNAKFYYVKKVEQVGCSWNAVMKYIGTANLPQANTPYAVILNKDEEKLEFDLHGKQATVQTATITDQYDSSEKWIFKGLYSYKVWKTGDPEIGLAYAFSGSSEGAVPKGRFGRIGDGTKAPPMRSYLTKASADVRLNCSTQAAPAAARAWGAASYTANFSNATADIIDVKFVEDDESGKEKTTAIGRLNTTTGEIKIDRWYDLKGRKVNNVNRAAKGVYYRRKIIDERR